MANIVVELTPGQVDFLNRLPSLDIEKILGRVEEPRPGTTDWILRHQKFTEWLRSPESHVFRIVGKLGSGKSVLAAFLHRSGIRQASKRRPFYISFPDSGEGRSAGAGWASLIHQLLIDDPSMFDKVLTQPGQYRRNAPGLNFNPWTDSRLRETFERLLLELRFPSIFIVDALDQCDEKIENFVASFAALGSKMASAKLLVLSRQGLATSLLDSRFPGIINIDLDDEVEHQRSIELAIEHKVGELCRTWHSPELSSTITTTLSESAQGMYLLPMIRVALLKQSNPTPKNITKLLNELPTSLLSVYRQSLDNIQECDRRRAASLILWVLFAARPLTVRELSSLVALEEPVDSAYELRQNTSIDLMGSTGIVGLVGPILKVSKSDGSCFVSLAHFSAQEFLLSTDRDTDEGSALAPPRWFIEQLCGSAHPPPRLSVSELKSRANRSLANRCLRYYLLSVPQTGSPSLPTRGKLIQFPSPADSMELDGWEPSLARFSRTATDSSYEAKGARRERMTRSKPSRSELNQGTGHGGRFSAKLAYHEDDIIYETLLDLATARTKMSTYDCTTEMDWTPFRSSSFIGDQAVPWPQTYEAKQYRFNLPSELERTTRGNPIPATSFHGACREFPALRYCIESLPEHVRLVQSSNFRFHRSFAAFLHSKFGGDWIEKFWTVRDPGQAYGRQPAVHFASALGLQPEVKSLLASGVRLDSRDQYGNTALDVATSNGDVDTIRLLHQIGKADIHARQRMSIMPDDSILKNHDNVLHTAAWYGHRDATLYLLSAGARPLVPDSDGQTPLDIAVGAQNRPLIKILMDKPSTQGALFSTIVRGRLETLKWLVEVENVDLTHCRDERDSWVPPGTGCHALEVAAQSNQLSCARYLSTLPLGSNEPYRNAYLTAATYGSVEVLEDFITRRVVDLNTVDTKGYSALHKACLAGKVATVSFLLRAGIDTGLRDDLGYTALEHLLAGGEMKCSYEEQREILTLCKDLRIRMEPPRGGGNILHVILKKGPLKPPPYSWIKQPDAGELIDTLLAMGLDPLETDSSGRTILHIAAHRDHSLFAKILSICDRANALDARGQTPLHTLLSSHYIYHVPEDNVKSLLERMPTISGQDHDGRTVMHYAVQSADWVFHAVLGRGQAINTQDNRAMTPLHLLMEGSEAIAAPLSRLRRLIESGADVHIMDKRGRTPLDVLIERIRTAKAGYWANGLLITLVKHGSEIGIVLDEEKKKKLFRALVAGGCIDDARVVLGLLCPGSATPSTDHPSIEAIDLEPLFPDFQDLRSDQQLTILKFIAASSASDQQLLHFMRVSSCAFKPTDPGWSISERFKGEWRLSFCVAAEQGHDAIPASLKRGAVLKAALVGDLAALRTFFDVLGWDLSGAVDHTGRTVLSLAAQTGKEELVRYLLHKGLSAEVVDGFGKRALYWAARYGKLGVVKLMVEYGAAVTNDAMEVGSVYGHEEVTVFLRDHIQELATRDNGPRCIEENNDEQRTRIEVDMF